MPPQLVAFPEGFRILIDKPIMLFGRDAECDIRFDSRKISRRHCCLAQIGDQLIVRDLGSTNGIRVNGIRVLEGYLRAGDELTIGGHRYQLAWDNVPAGEEKPAVRNVREREPQSAPPDEPIRLADSALLPPGQLPPLEQTPPPSNTGPAPNPPAATPSAAPAPPAAFGIPDDIPLLGSSGDIEPPPPEPPRKSG
jgi:pSer/pThr/pTyr-binding forkhead associated (FHA) protein